MSASTDPSRQTNAHDRQVEASEFYDLKAEVRAHAATDQLQFEGIREKLAEIGKVVNRISWAGWPIAVGVATLLYQAFTHHQ